MIKSSPRDLPSTLSRCECSGLRRPPIRLRRRRPKTASAASAHAGPFKPRRYRPRRANGAVPSRRRRAAPRVLEIATRAPSDPFRGPPRIFASGFDNFSCFRSAPMHVTLGPRQGASDQPRFRPAASASRLFSGHISRTSESGTVLSAVSYEGQVTAHVEPVARPRPRRCKTGRARRDFVSARRERAARKTCN